METNKKPIFNIFMSIFFALIIFGGYFYVIFGQFQEPLKPTYFYFGCVCACFLFSLFFVKVKSKETLVTLALALTVVADYYLVLNLSGAEENRLIGLCVFCAVQLVYALYTLTLNRSIGTRVINIALRVALCMLIYFIVPLYFELALIEMISLMYIANFVVSILVLLVHIKTHWLMLLGYLLFFACDIFVGLINGGAAFFGITGDLLNFILSHDIAFYCYIPGLFLIALSTVWKKEKKE